MWKKVRCAAAGLRVPPSGRVKKCKSCLARSLSRLSLSLSLLEGRGSKQHLRRRRKRTKRRGHVMSGALHFHDLPNGRRSDAAAPPLERAACVRKSFLEMSWGGSRAGGGRLGVLARDHLTPHNNTREKTTTITTATTCKTSLTPPTLRSLCSPSISPFST